MSQLNYTKRPKSLALTFLVDWSNEDEKTKTRRPCCMTEKGFRLIFMQISYAI
jgi:hypothetical protein